MKKALFTFIIVTCFFSLSNAQSKQMAIGGGFVVAFPVGNASNVFSTGIGGTAIFEYKPMPMLAITGTIGYVHFSGKTQAATGFFSTQGPEVSSNAIPLLAGIKYYFVPNLGFYGLAQLGLHFYSTSVDYPQQNFGGFFKSNSTLSPDGAQQFGFAQSSSVSETKFSFGIGGGYELPTGPDGAIDLSAKFMIISDANYFGLRAGYKFKF